MSEITTEEKRKIIKETYGDFPMRIAFNLYIEENEHLSIGFTRFRNEKIKLNNIKFSSIKPFMLNSPGAPLGVYEVENFEHLEKLYDNLSEQWGIKER